MTVKPMRGRGTDMRIARVACSLLGCFPYKGTIWASECIRVLQLYRHYLKYNPAYRDHDYFYRHIYFLPLLQMSNIGIYSLDAESIFLPDSIIHTNLFIDEIHHKQTLLR